MLEAGPLSQGLPGPHIPTDRHLPTADGWKTKTTRSEVETDLSEEPKGSRDALPPALGERAHAHSTTSTGGDGYQGNTDMSMLTARLIHVDCLPSHLLES